MNRWSITAMTLLLAACGRGEGENEGLAGNGQVAGDAVEAAGEWDLVSSGEGVALVLGGGGDGALRLYCPAGEGRLMVNVPAFRPVGSEERMSFGSGGEVVTLVADATGDRDLSGVTGSGSVPDALASILAGPVAVNYGAQNSGPHPAPPDQLVRAFAGACVEGSAGQAPPPASGNEPAPPPAQSGSACLTGRDGRPIPANRIRAVGTEPFWGARVEGRCVTYSHPENIDGTRVWTEFSGTAERGEWRGHLGNRRFVMRTRPQPGCSDGMSDNRYPIAVTLTLGGEERRGCAERL